jgi:hypothetical protein
MGTGAGTALVTDTDLFTPSSEPRVAGTSSSVTSASGPANDTHQVQALIVADAAKTFTNVGLWDALTGGTLCAKSDFAGIPLASGDGINWTLKTRIA